VHITSLVPTGNDDPDEGAQLETIGATPPATVGLNDTLAAVPFFESTGPMTGHEIVSGGSPLPDPVVGAGVVGVVLAVAANTVTLDVHDTVVSFASVAVQASGVLPTGKSEPDAGVQRDEIGAVPPETVGANDTGTALPVVDVADGAGHMMASGAVDVGAVYDTITAVLHEAVSWTASVTVHVVGVVPTGKSDPDAGEQAARSGAVPPLKSGANATTTGPPSVDVP
jgi:hypothetical protein